jgi:hypothetical protein
MEKFAEALRNWWLYDLLLAGPWRESFIGWLERVEANDTRGLLEKNQKPECLEDILERLNRRYKIPPKEVRKIIVKNEFLSTVRSFDNDRFPGQTEKLRRKRKLRREAERIRSFADDLRGWAHMFAIDQELLSAGKTLYRLADSIDSIKVSIGGPQLKSQHRAALARDLYACFLAITKQKPLYIEIAKILHLVDQNWNPVKRPNGEIIANPKQILTQAVKTLLGFRKTVPAESKRIAKPASERHES